MIKANDLLKQLPSGLRDPLLDAYTEVVRNYAEHRWEPSELNGGKLCEIVYSIVDGATSGSYPSAPRKPQKMLDACRAIEQRPANTSLIGDRSLRILIPRVLPFLYEIRNNRGVGHVGGDVNPNLSDATAVLSCSTWLIAELTRIFHGTTIEEAEASISVLVERKHPIVWGVDGIKRVLDPKLRRDDQVLILLYSSTDWVGEDDIRSWVEYKNKSQFRGQILKRLHEARLIEFQQILRRLRITPRGSKDVEDRLLINY